MDFPLNKAHSEQQRAQHLIKKGQINEAVECYVRASQLLEDTLSSVQHFSTAIESLQLQYNRNLKLIEVLRNKKLQMESEENSKQCKSDYSPSRSFRQKKPKQRHVAVQASPEDAYIPYSDDRFINQPDSMLHVWMLKGDCRADTLHQKANPIVGIKLPKDDKMTIEELKQSNVVLKNFIEELMQERDELKSSNLVLRKQVDELRTKLTEAGISS